MTEFHYGTFEIGEDAWKRFVLPELFSETGHTYVLTSDSPTFTKIKYDDRLILFPRDGDDGDYRLTVLSSSGRVMSIEVSVADTINSSGSQYPEPIPQPEPNVTEEGSTLDYGIVETREDGWNRIMLPDHFGEAGLTYALSADAPSFVKIKDGTKLILYPRDGDVGDYSLTVTGSNGKVMTVAVSVADTIDPGVEPEPAPVEPDPEPSGGTQKSLQARYLGNQLGEVEWADKVTLTGYDAYGDLAKVWFDTDEFDDDGFGVAGPSSRWDTQIDYFEWGGAGPRSEKLVINFNGDAEDVFIFTSMMSSVEGPDDLDETGKWRAYNEGVQVAEGVIGPESGKVAGTYGTYKVAIGDMPIDRIEIEATQMDHGASDSFSRPHGEESSDFGIMGVDYTRLDYDL